MLEILMDPLAALVITFFVLSFISIAALVLMYLLKNEKVKKGIFFFAVAWSVIITWCNVLASAFWIEEIIIALILGALGIVALLYQFIAKKANKFLISRILVTVSVAAGMIDCFLI